MQAADLESMTPDELQTLAQSVQAALEKRQKEQARHVLAEARRMAASVGYEAAFTKVGKPSQRQTARKKVAPKYRNPDNPQDVWSGRGRQPAWVQKALAAGLSLDRLVIAQGEAPSRKTV